MASQEELNQEMINTLRELQNLTSSSGTLTTATNAQAQSAKNFQAKMDVATGALGGLGKAFVSYNKAVYDGQLGAKAFSGALSDLSDAVKTAAVGLAVLSPGGPVIKGLILAAGFLASKLIETGKEVTEQTGKIFDAFQDLARAGAAAGDGMQGVFNGLQKMGLGVEQFNEYTRIIGENTDKFAQFAGTVADGRHALEDTVKGLRGFRTDLGVLGLDRAKLVDATAQYIRVQSNLTRQTKEQMDLSGEAVMRYVRETDLLTRITGASRKKQEELMEKAQSEEIFGSFIDELTDQGNKSAAKNFQNMNTLLETKLGPDFAQGMRDAVVAPTSEAAQRFVRTTGAAGQTLLEKLRESGKELTPEEMGAELNKLARTVKETNETFRPLRTVGGDVAKLFGSNAELRKANQLLAQDMQKTAKGAQEQQKAQLADENARKMQETINAQQEEQLALQKTVNLGMSDSITVMRATAIANRDLAEAALRAAQALNLIGGGPSGGGGSSAFDAGGSDAAAIMGASAAGISGTRGATPTTGAGGLVSRMTGAVAGGLQALGFRGPDYYLKGDKTGLDERLLNAMGLAAKEYGNPITINSGFRSAEEQARMYQEWVEGGGGPGKPTVRTPSFGNVTTPAPPGQSRHQSGMALDIDRNIADELDKKGILAKYGLARPVPGDPVHIQLEKFEFGGSLGAGRMGIAGEAGAELITGPADITPMNDLMRELGSLNQVSGAMLMALKDIARKQGEVVDTSKRMLQVAQN